jgi:hypothetical protein
VVHGREWAECWWEDGEMIPICAHVQYSHAISLALSNQSPASLHCVVFPPTLRCPSRNEVQSTNRCRELWREAESDSNAVCQTGILGSDEGMAVKVGEPAAMSVRSAGQQSLIRELASACRALEGRFPAVYKQLRCL